MTASTTSKSHAKSSARNRRSAAREARRKKQQRQRLIWTVVGIVAVVVIGALIVRAILTPEPGEAIPSMGNTHIDESQVGLISYNSTPPTSGPHLGNLARWGIHSQPIPNELQVHNLEDGGVMVQYNCPEGCDELVAQLTAIVNRYEDHVILAPYPDMEPRIALTAWGRIDTFDQFDAERVERFIEAYSEVDHHAG